MRILAVLAWPSSQGCARPACSQVSNFFAWRGEENLLPFPHLWRKEDGWREALEAYLASGGYQRRVEPGCA